MVAADTLRPPEADSPVSAEESLRHFQIDPACRIELAAAEPEVVDPVAIRFDEDGRMWVVEMRDYPHGPKPGEEPASCIKVLEDKDSDGRFESATLFADKLLFPTGLQPWKGGVFVTLAGRVAYMKDTDGDGRCDLDETWFTGFAEENSQLRASHPTLALDNHIYVANGLRGGKIVDARRKDRPPIDISGKDFRFDPLTGDCEAVTGPSQFGLTFDDWGNRFFCTNRNPLVHVVIEDRYLRANPYVRIPTAVQDVAAAGEQSRLCPLTRAWTTSNLHAGQFTAACGVCIYRGDALPKEFYGNAFTCDPTGNLVHREIISPRGATFQSKPAYEGREFLASTDEWFRPVDLTLGPDGALYVVDMYRAVIEHPEFMPDELKSRPDLMLGKERGRVYRMIDSVLRPVHESPRLSQLTSEELVQQLEYKNAWRRETAQRLLLERQDKKASDSLASMLQKGTNDHARVQAAWALQGIGQLDQLALQPLARRPADYSPSVLRHAFEASQRTVPFRFFSPRFEDEVIRGDNQREQVCYLLAASRREADEPTPSGRLRFLPVSRERFLDVWLCHAVAVSAGGRTLDWLKMLAYHNKRSARERTDGERQLASVLADSLAARLRLSDAKALSEVFGWLAELSCDESHPLRVPILGAFLDRLEKRRFGLSLLHAEGAFGAPVEKIVAALELQIPIAADPTSDVGVRCDAMRLASHVTSADEMISSLALAEPSVVVRIRAIQLLAARGTNDDFRALIDRFPQEPPEIRSAILESLMTETQTTRLLMDSVGSGQIKPGELGQTRVNQLLNHGDSEIRERATKLLADAIPADRQKVLADYRKNLPLEADPHRGLTIFRKHCAQCHRVGEVGVNVAPDISDSRVKTELQILTDIVQPNRAIDANYLAYTVNTSDGRALTGVIAAEAGSSVTLRMAEGKEITLLRDEIAEMGTSGTSLMPEGLEKEISYRDMADLIAYVKRWRYLDGRTPLGRK